MVLPPDDVQNLWRHVVSNFGMLPLSEVCKEQEVVDYLLGLFAIADEACAGMGWDELPTHPHTPFSLNVIRTALAPDSRDPYRLPYWPRSLCGMVSPDHVIVLPKSITTTKGCTIRSLSHHLALLPCRTTLDPSWFFVSRPLPAAPPDTMRLLLVPFPYQIPDDCFEVSFPRTPLSNGTSYAAFFQLHQHWLGRKGLPRITGAALARKIVLPLIEQVRNASNGVVPNGIVLPECALSPQVAQELVQAIADTGVEFLITGVLEKEPETGNWLNQARTYAIVDSHNVLCRQQNKHHRWRIDQTQADAYGLNFDTDQSNHQWWEDIDISRRSLPFYALGRDMSMVTLICEDLARMDPAMNAIRSVGPNLVVALLMDGPQLISRWPGRYAGVLADEPGCAVLSLTCAATVDRSNASHVRNNPAGTPARVIALWAQADGRKEQLSLADGDMGVLLELRCVPKHQTTLDNRSDRSASRELQYRSHLSLGV